MSKIHLGDALTHAVDCQNYLITKTLLQYAASNDLLQGKAIPVEAFDTEFRCKVRQRYNCGPECQVRNGEMPQTTAQPVELSGNAVKRLTKLISMGLVEAKIPTTYYHFHVLEEDVTNPFEAEELLNSAAFESFLEEVAQCVHKLDEYNTNLEQIKDLQSKK